MTKEFTFSDLSTSLEILDSGEFKILYDEETVIQSIRTIFATISGERVRNPIGSTLIRMLFEPMTDYTAMAINRIAAQVIIDYEPRVTINSISVEPNYELNVYDLNAVLYIKKLNREVVFATKLNSLYGDNI